MKAEERGAIITGWYVGVKGRTAQDLRKAIAEHIRQAEAAAAEKERAECAQLAETLHRGEFANMLYCSAGEKVAEAIRARGGS